MTIEEWDISDLMDWSRRRDEINPLFYSICGYDLSNYNNLTISQKKIGAKYFFVHYELRVSNGIFTDIEDEANWKLLLMYTKEGRITCVEAMRLSIGNQIRVGKISMSNAHVFFKDVSGLIDWFINSNTPDFKQWIINEANSPYEYKGFKQTKYWSQEMQDVLIGIYNGNY